MNSYYCIVFIILDARGHTDMAKYMVSVHKQFTILLHVSYMKHTRVLCWLAFFSVSDTTAPPQ